MNKISYSFHISSKNHALSTINKVLQASKHNLRSYASPEYDRSKIAIICGSDKSILDDIKRIYHEEFDAPLARYNSDKRPDRQIPDYLDHVSESHSDIACEIIIQIGDRDFWSDKSHQDKQCMTPIYTDQLEYLRELVPELRIASAVIHFDESSPHMHVIGVPVADGFCKGLDRQVSKTRVFTRDRLSHIQDKLHERADQEISFEPIFDDVVIKTKEPGRNKDIPKYALDQYYALQNDIHNLREDKNSLDKETHDATSQLVKTRATAEKMRADTEHLINKKSEIGSELEALTDRYDSAVKVIETADLLRDEANLLSSTVKILTAAKVKKIDKNVKSSILNKDKVVLSRADYEALIKTAQAAEAAIKEAQIISMEKYTILFDAKREADKLLEDAHQRLAESFSEECRRKEIERSYNDMLADPIIREYLDYKKSMSMHSLEQTRDIDSPDIDIGDFD